VNVAWLDNEGMTFPHPFRDRREQRDRDERATTAKVSIVRDGRGHVISSK